MNPHSSHAPGPTGWLDRTIGDPNVWGFLWVAGSVAVTFNVNRLVNEETAVVDEHRLLQFGQLPSGGGSHERDLDPRTRILVASATSTAMASSSGSGWISTGDILFLVGE